MSMERMIGNPSAWSARHWAGRSEGLIAGPPENRKSLVDRQSGSTGQIK
jgi:hypothetical protein